MSASKDRGTKWETAVVRYLQESIGTTAIERRALHGTEDKGDIAGIPDWVLECKDEQRITLSEYLKEAEREAENAGVNFYAAVVKARRKSVANAYVVVPLHMLPALILATQNANKDEVKNAPGNLGGIGHGVLSRVDRFCATADSSSPRAEGSAHRD